MNEHLRLAKIECAKISEEVIYELINQHESEAAAFLGMRDADVAYVQESITKLRDIMRACIARIRYETIALLDLKLGFATIFYPRIVEGTEVNVADPLARWDSQAEDPSKRHITTTFHYTSDESFLGALHAMERHGQGIIHSVRSGETVDKLPYCFSFSGSSLADFLGGGRVFGGRYTLNNEERVLFTIPFEAQNQRHTLLKNYGEGLAARRAQAAETQETRMPALNVYTVEDDEGRTYMVIDGAIELFDPKCNTSYTHLPLRGYILVEGVRLQDPETGETARALLQMGGFDNHPQMGDLDFHLRVHQLLNSKTSEAGTLAQRIINESAIEELKKRRRILSPSQHELIHRNFYGAWAHRLLNLLSFENKGDPDQTEKIEQLLKLADYYSKNEFAGYVSNLAKELVDKVIEEGGTIVDLLDRRDHNVARLGGVFEKVSEWLNLAEGLANVSAHDPRKKALEFITKVESDFYGCEGSGYNMHPGHFKALLERELFGYYLDIQNTLQQVNLAFALTSKNGATRLRGELEKTLRHLEGGGDFSTLEVINGEDVKNAILQVCTKFEGADIDLSMENFESCGAIEALYPILERLFEVVAHNASKYGAKNDAGRVPLRVSSKVSDGHLVLRFSNIGVCDNESFRTITQRAKQISLQTQQGTKSADSKGGHGVGTMLVRTLVSAQYSDPETWDPEATDPYCNYSARLLSEDNGQITYEWTTTVRLRLAD